MNSDRFLEILDAYGATPTRWPEREREAMLALLEQDDSVQQAYEEAASFDALLDRAHSPMPSPELMADILMAAQAPLSLQWTSLLWPFGPIWKPATGLVAVAIIGISLGSVAPYYSSNDLISSEIEYLIQD